VHIRDEQEAVFRSARERLFRYRIFPRAILRPLVDASDGVVRDGATVVFIASLPGLPLSIEAAVCVVRTWDTATDTRLEAGLEIATLAGHPERGWERFSIELDQAGGTLALTIESWSAPGSLLVRLGGPFGRWLQRRASEAAVREFVEQAATRPRDRAADAR
jgi:uncharacterized protein (UPF0548 family)